MDVNLFNIIMLKFHISLFYFYILELTMFILKLSVAKQPQPRRHLKTIKKCFLKTLLNFFLVFKK